MSKRMHLTTFLGRSAATESFRAALVDFLGSGEPNDRINFGHRAPPIKVERTLTKILDAYPALPIERVTIDGVSGCESFRGRATIEAQGRAFDVEFEWNCRWKADQMGWTDWFGFPDQSRAAQEFGYDCFSRWDEVDEDERNAA